MAWNAPGKNQKPQADNTSRKPDVPPNLDEVLKAFQRKLKSWLGRKKSLLKPESEHPKFSVSWGPLLIFIVIILLLIWVIAGFFIVEPSEKAVILKWGKYEKTVGPGLHWVPVFISSRQILNMQELFIYQDKTDLLTVDRNIVQVNFKIKYNINTPVNYLFKMAYPDEVLHEASLSVLRELINQKKLDDVYQSSLEKLSQQMQGMLGKRIDAYQSGIKVMEVTIISINPPQAIKDSSNTISDVQQENVKAQNQASAYAKQTILNAQTQANQLINSANLDKQKIISNAQSEVAEFLALLPVYKKNPQLIHDKLYLDTMQFVFDHSEKVIVDFSGKNNTVYFPVEKLSMNAQNSQGNQSYSQNAQNTPNSSGANSSFPTEKNNNAIVQNQTVASEINNNFYNGYPSRPSYNFSGGQ